MKQIIFTMLLLGGDLAGATDVTGNQGKTTAVKSATPAGMPSVLSGGKSVPVYPSIAAFQASLVSGTASEGKVTGSGAMHYDGNTLFHCDGKKAIRAVASRTNINDMLNKDKQYLLSQSTHFAAGDIQQIGVNISNYYSFNGETPSIGTHDATVQVAIEYPIPGTNEAAGAGTSASFTGMSFAFGGKATGVVPPGKDLATDLLKLPKVIPAGAKFRLRISWYNPDGVIYHSHGFSSFPAGLPNKDDVTNMREDFAFIGTSNFSMPTLPGYVSPGFSITYGDATVLGAGTGWTNTYGGNFNNTGVYLPAVIFGITTKPVPAVGIVGDSIQTASAITGTDQGTWDYFGGDIERGLGTKVATMNSGMGGDSFSKWVNEGYYPNSKRASLLQKYCTTIVTDMGVNDVGGLAALETVQKNATQFVAWWKSSGIPVFLSTITPFGIKSTDSFTTLSGQTINTAYVPVRVGYNQWVRSGKVPEMAGFLERAYPVETDVKGVHGNDGGYWATDINTVVSAHYEGDMVVSSITSGAKNLIRPGDWAYGKGGFAMTVPVNHQILPTTLKGLGGIGTYHIAAKVAQTTDVPVTVGLPTLDGTHPCSRGSIAIANYGAAKWPIKDFK